MMKCTSLEVTGNFMEVPPAREPTSPRKRPSVPSDISSLASSNNNRRKSSVLSSGKSTNVTTPPKSQPTLNQRSVSQQSTSTTNKKQNSIPSLSSADAANYEEEMKKLKRRIDELEMHLRISQKFGKDREKQVDELNKKLNDSIQQECLTNQKLSEALKLIESLRHENESISKQLANSHELNNIELNRLKQEISKIKDDHEVEMRKIKDEHLRETKIREEKLENLKKQIAGAFKDNSWERQLQIDELTKELKRAQEECELIKHKLKGYKNKHADSCPNCENMLQKLESKTNDSREKEAFIVDLISLMGKFQAQFNFHDELVRLQKLSSSSSSSSTTNNNPFISQQIIELLSQQQRVTASSNYANADAKKLLINRKDSLSSLKLNNTTNNNNIINKK